MELEQSVSIGREQGDVWEVLRAPALMPEWFDKLGNFAAVEGDGTGQGDRYTIDYLRDSGPVGLSVDVLEVDEQVGHVHRFSGLPVAFTIASRLSSAGDRATLWTATIEVRLSLVQRALTPVIKGYLDDLSGHMAEGFKTYVEGR